MIFDELREIQRQFGYLPAEQLRALAEKIDLPLYRLHGVASFYPHFRLTPPPRVDLRVCQDMSCHLRGACQLRLRLESTFPESGHNAGVLRDQQQGWMVTLSRVRATQAQMLFHRVILPVVLQSEEPDALRESFEPPQ